MRFISSRIFRSAPLLIVLVAAISLGASFLALRFARHKTVAIGFVGTLSGPAGHTGLRCMDGALLAVDDCNSNGGIGGLPVWLDVHDDRGEPATASDAIHAMATSSTWAVIGPTDVSVAQASAEAAENHGLLLISPTLTADAYQPSPIGPASVRLTASVAAEYITRHLRSNRDLRHPAIVIDKTCDEYVTGMESAVGQAFATSGASIADVIELPAPQERDYGQTAHRLVGTGADSVLIFACSADAALLLQHLRAAHSELPVICYEPCSPDDLIAYAGWSAEGLTLISCVPARAGIGWSRDFADRFRRRFGRDPDMLAAHAYEATRLALLSIADSETPQDVRPAMLARQYFDGLHGRISIGSSGAPRRELHVVRCQNGVLTAFD